MALKFSLCVFFLSFPLFSAPVTFTIYEGKTTEIIPARLHLKDDKGKPITVPGLPFWKDHLVCTGRVTVASVAAGPIHFEVERGPEYLPVRGSIPAETETNVAIHIHRLADMKKEGWWSGELHVHRPPEEIALHLAAEDLHMAGVITWWNEKNLWKQKRLPTRLRVPAGLDRDYEVMGGEDERQGGALLFFGLDKPMNIASARPEWPSPMLFARTAIRDPHAWLDIEKPFWWDVPTWVSQLPIRSIGIANNHMCRSQMYENEAWGRPRDTNRLASPLGNGYWTQEIYYHLLNCGFEIAPSAGSASGVLPNPVGYNRVYVQLGKRWDPDAWWKELEKGRSFVSNGPLLRVRANGKWPGERFRLSGRKPLELDLQAELDSGDPIRVVEVIRNGTIVQSLDFETFRRKGLRSLSFTKPGWFVVRAVTGVPETFRFASTAPFYVHGADGSHVSDSGSASFFLDWVRERMGRIEKLQLPNAEEVLKYHRAAETFWRRKSDSPSNHD